MLHISTGCHRGTKVYLITMTSLRLEEHVNFGPGLDKNKVKESKKLKRTKQTGKEGQSKKNEEKGKLRKHSIRTDRKERKVEGKTLDKEEKNAT